MLMVFVFFDFQGKWQSEKKRADELEECCEERRKKLEETDKKVVQLQESMSRFFFQFFCIFITFSY